MSNSGIDHVLAEIKGKVSFHKSWRRNTMLGHTVAAVVAAGCSGAAAVTAAFGMSAVAAVLAATTTFLMVVEKGLLLREKWRIHLVTQIRMENVGAQLVAGTITTEDALLAMAKINEEYAQSLPISSREQGFAGAAPT